MSTLAAILLTPPVLLIQSVDGVSTSEESSDAALAFSFTPLVDTPDSPWTTVLGRGERRLGVSSLDGMGAMQFSTPRMTWDAWPDRPVSIELLAAERAVYEPSGVRVGRSTFLVDGGVEGEPRVLGDETYYSILRESGEFDLYDISVDMRVLGSHELGIKMISGFRAIRANVGETTTSTDASGKTVSTYNKSRGMIAVPVIGAGVEWRPAPGFSLEGAAVTHAIDTQATYLDLTAEARIHFSHNVGFVTGYQFMRSTMEVRDIEADLSDNGLFARLQIRF